MMNEELTLRDKAAVPPDVRKGFAFPTTTKESSGGYAALVRQSLEE